MSSSTDYQLGLITQDRGLERIMKRISKHFGSSLTLYESCVDFVKDHDSGIQGVVIVDGAVCSRPRLMDLQLVLNEVPAWQVVYLPQTKKRQEVKEAMELGAFGSLHKPVSEHEVRQMLRAVTGVNSTWKPFHP
jgi:DNA-binding NtrC family response regulator